MPVVAPPTPSAEPSDDDLLLGRVARGALVGFVLMFVLAAGMLSVEIPDVPLAGRLGAALFLAFWTGPFFGMVGGIGFHHLRLHRAEQAGEAGSPGHRGVGLAHT